MKAMKYLVATLVVVFALAGCAAGSGSSNFDTIDDAEQSMQYGG